MHAAACFSYACLISFVLLLLGVDWHCFVKQRLLSSANGSSLFVGCVTVEVCPDALREKIKLIQLKSQALERYILHSVL